VHEEQLDILGSSMASDSATLPAVTGAPASSPGDSYRTVSHVLGVQQLRGGSLQYNTISGKYTMTSSTAPIGHSRSMPAIRSAAHIFDRYIEESMRLGNYDNDEISKVPKQYWQPLPLRVLPGRAFM
jgi:hypothetical protein